MNASKSLAPERPGTSLQNWENEGGAPRHDQPARTSSTTTERIRARAFEIYKTRQSAGRPGTAVTDWAEAEREIGTDNSPRR